MSSKKPSVAELLRTHGAVLTSSHLRELGWTRTHIDAMWRAWVSAACLGLEAVPVDQRRFDIARAPLRRSLSRAVSLRAPVLVSIVLDVVALAATDAKSAARLLGKSDEVKEETREPRPVHWTSSYERAAAAAVDALGEEQFDAEYAAGRALSLDDAVALALEVIDA